MRWIENSPESGRIWPWLMGLLLLASALWFVPLFLCSPLWVDITHYDVCAQEVLRGRVLYRDVADINFPGIVWIHMLVRSLVGWRSEALRAFDLLMLGIAAGVLSRIAKAGSAPRAYVPYVCAWLMALFYFACPSICHCQRDVWMLALASVALWFRWQHFTDLTPRWYGALALAFAEGVCWGAAVWIKPYVVVPALCCWIVGQVLLWQERHRSPAIAWGDNLLFLFGGAIVGLAGISWLISTDSWDGFWEVPIGWSQQYRLLETTLFARLRRLLGWHVLYFPWSLALLFALVVAIMTLVRVFRDSQAFSSTRERSAVALLAALYLGWFAQAIVLQHPHDYVFTTLTLIALPVLMLSPLVAQPDARTKASLATVLVVILVLHPLLQYSKARHWLQCWREGSSPVVRDALGTPRLDYGEAHWQDLVKVEDFLRSRHAQDQEVLSWDDSSHPLYVDLQIAPASRLIHANVWLNFFGPHKREFIHQFEQTQPRFVITDLRLLRFPPEELSFRSDIPSVVTRIPEPIRQSFPWREPVVFRAGRYLVHEVQRRGT